MDDILQRLKMDPALATTFSNGGNILGDPLEGHKDFLDELFGATPGAVAAVTGHSTVPTMALSAVAGTQSSPSQAAGSQHSAATLHAQLPPHIQDAVPMGRAQPDAPPTGAVEAPPATAAAPPRRASAGTSVAHSPPTTAALDTRANHPRASSTTRCLGGKEVAPRHGGRGPPTTVAPPQRETALYKEALRRSHSLSAPTISSPSPRVSTPATTPSPPLPMPTTTRYEPSPSTRQIVAPATSPATTSATPAGRIALPAGPSSRPRALATATVSKLDTLKRARPDDDEEADGDSRRNTDVPAKRPAMAEAWQARSALDVPLAQSSAPVGRHVQSDNKNLPQHSSHAPRVDGESAAPSENEDGEAIQDEYTGMFDEVELPDDATGDDAAGADEDSDAGSLFDEDESAPAQPQTPMLALPGGGSAGPVLDGAALMGLTARDAAIRAARPAPRPMAPSQALALPVAGPSHPVPQPPSPPQPSGKKKKARTQARGRGQSKPAGPTPAKEETPEQRRARKVNSNAVALRAAIGNRYPWMTETAEAGSASTSAPAAAGPSHAVPQPAAPAAGAAPAIAPSIVARAAPNPGTYEQRAAKDPNEKNPTTGPAPLTKSRYCDICWQRGMKGIWFTDQGLRDHLRKATSPGHPNAKST